MMRTAVSFDLELDVMMKECKQVLYVKWQYLSWVVARFFEVSRMSKIWVGMDSLPRWKVVPFVYD
jgi:hypothetical protein